MNAAASACLIAGVLIIVTIAGIYTVTNWNPRPYKAQHSHLSAPDLPSPQEPVPGIADPGCSPSDLTVFDNPPVMARRYVPDDASSWPGQPDACTCTRMTVETLEETLGCPAGWRYAPGTGWLHPVPAVTR